VESLSPSFILDAFSASLESEILEILAEIRKYKIKKIVKIINTIIARKYLSILFNI
jgi:hypothetical protein